VCHLIFEVKSLDVMVAFSKEKDCRR